MTGSGSRRAVCVGGCPTVRARVVPATCVKNAAVSFSAPDNHLTAGPHCRVKFSGIGRVGGTRGRPSIDAGFVSAAGLQRVWVVSAPDDHVATGPHCRVIVSGGGHAGGTGGCPAIGAGIVLPASIKIAVDLVARDDHLAVGPQCRTKYSASRRVSGSGPDNHFASRPDCRVKCSASGHADGAGSYPTISTRIVFPARVQKVVVNIKKILAPDDHFASRPDCGVKLSALGRVSGAGGCPTISARIVFAAGVEEAIRA